MYQTFFLLYLFPVCFAFLTLAVALQMYLFRWREALEPDSYTFSEKSRTYERRVWSPDAVLNLATSINLKASWSIHEVKAGFHIFLCRLQWGKSKSDSFYSAGYKKRSALELWLQWVQVGKRKICICLNYFISIFTSPVVTVANDSYGSIKLHICHCTVHVCKK